LAEAREKARLGAYQLAPECTNLDDVRHKLKKEGYSSVEEHLQGGSIQKDLRRLLKRT
jgi:hypothetical protein